MKTILSSLFAFALLLGGTSLLPSQAAAKGHDNGVSSVNDAGEREVDPPMGGRNTGVNGDATSAAGSSGGVRDGQRSDTADGQGEGPKSE